MADEQNPERTGPRLGTYSGTLRDYSCPGDHVTWEITLLEGNTCTIGCRSELSPSKGGLQAWSIEGTWEWDEDEEVLVTVTKDDPLGGPKRERDIELAWAADQAGGYLTFDRILASQQVVCQWSKPLPDKIAEELEAMTLKDLKAAALASGIDPAGCVERGEFMALLGRARSSGRQLILRPPPEPSPEPSASPASSGKSPTKSAPSGSAGASPTAVASPTGKPTAPSSSPPPGSADASPAAGSASPAGDIAEPEEGCYSLEELTDKRVWEKLDIKSTERETYLPQAVFSKLFDMPKAEFAKLPKWKKDNLKKKHGLF